MGYIITIAISVTSAMLIFILQSVLKENHRLKQEKEAQEKQKENALENGVVCLLRVKLIEYHEKYMGLGSISSHGLQNWLKMYEAYKALGGNGMIDHMKAEIEELHIENH
jgi:hypothetical protein